MTYIYDIYTFISQSSQLKNCDSSRFPSFRQMKCMSQSRELRSIQYQHSLPSSGCWFICHQTTCSCTCQPLMKTSTKKKLRKFVSRMSAKHIIQIYQNFSFHFTQTWINLYFSQLDKTVLQIATIIRKQKVCIFLRY